MIDDICLFNSFFLSSRFRLVVFDDNKDNKDDENDDDRGAILFVSACIVQSWLLRNKRHRQFS